MIKQIIIIFMTFLCSNMGFSENVLRIAGWGGEIPTSVFKKFEEKTQIKVYFSSFESNESLDVKLRTSSKSQYDLIMPSSYFVPKLMQSKLLMPLDLKQVPAYQKINTFFTQTQLNPIYAIPFNWSATGIFYNKKSLKLRPRHWQDLWRKELANQVLLLDDSREVFSMALISLGYSPNDENPKHIDQAYQQLLKLRPNIKLFASDAVPNLLIDEDALIGMAWNADILKAQTENPNIGFVLPKEGYIVNSESFAIPQDSQHITAAYAFINFMLEPENLALMTLKNHFPPTTDLEHILPKATLENPILFPNPALMHKGILQKNVSEKTLTQYNELWERFKLSL
ncbi:MAG: spermidine/putrescine ABC transporter substrate-binding protein [Gammaproteobacteria bacterium]|nr:spermidine/putrescine ABC transporter substrate-binding protein [Gammaproteobacteria bacterium]